ncbi:MAG: hypothetical protein ACQESF_02265 [Nanobdellota archaeon]
MKKNNKFTGLSNIIKKPHHSSNHPVRDHPHENISTHIASVMFLSMLFLFSVGIFFLSEPCTNTAFAIVDFSNIDIDLGITEKAKEITSTLMRQELREELMMIAYISWILIVGAANLYFVEKEYKHYHKK